MNFLQTRTALALLAIGLLTSTTYTFAAEQLIEEIIVTARQQAETLQDVPVTIAALTEEDLDRYNITNLVDAAKMVPNMVVAQGSSGNNASLNLRGIGSSSISAAFDHSVQEDVVAVKHMQQVLSDDTTEYKEININGDKAAVLFRRTTLDWVLEEYPDMAKS